MTEQDYYRSVMQTMVHQLRGWVDEMSPAKNLVEQERINVYEQIADSMEFAITDNESVPV